MCPCRVAELCSIVEAVSGEEVKGQVLMTSSGQQMDPSNIIGTYSVGTVSHAPLLCPYKCEQSCPRASGSPP